MNLHRFHLTIQKNLEGLVNLETQNSYDSNTIILFVQFWWFQL